MIKVFRHNGHYGYKAVLDVLPRSIIIRGQGCQSIDEALDRGRRELFAEALRTASEHWELARIHLEHASQYNERGKVVSCIAQAKQEMEIAAQIFQLLFSSCADRYTKNKQSDICVCLVSCENILSLAHYGSLVRVRELLAKILEQLPCFTFFFPDVDGVLPSCLDTPPRSGHSALR